MNEEIIESLTTLVIKVLQTKYGNDLHEYMNLTNLEKGKIIEDSILENLIENIDQKLNFLSFSDTVVRLKEIGFKEVIFSRIPMADRLPVEFCSDFTIMYHSDYLILSSIHKKKENSVCITCASPHFKKPLIFDNCLNFFKNFEANGEIGQRLCSSHSLQMIELNDLPLLTPSEIAKYPPMKEEFDHFCDRHPLSDCSQLDYTKKLEIFKGDYLEHLEYLKEEQKRIRKRRLTQFPKEFRHWVNVLEENKKRYR